MGLCKFDCISTVICISRLKQDNQGSEEVKGCAHIVCSLFEWPCIADMLFIIMCDAPVVCFDVTEVAEGLFPCFVIGNKNVNSQMFLWHSSVISCVSSTIG